MQLSAHDLKQLNDKNFSSLERENLEILASKLLSDVKELHDRLNQNPENSSRPPSSALPWGEMNSASKDVFDEEEDDFEDEKNLKEKRDKEEKAADQGEGDKVDDSDKTPKKTKKRRRKESRASERVLQAMGE